MRVVIADDACSCAGLARLLVSPESRWSAQAADAEALLARSTTLPTSRSSTSACLRPTPTRARRRARDPRAIRTRRAGPVRVRRGALCRAAARDSARGSDTCSRTASTDTRDLRRGAQARGRRRARRSIRRSSLELFAVTGGPDPLAPLTSARARGARARRRGSRPTRASAERLVAQRGHGARSTPLHLHQTRPARRRRRPPARSVGADLPARQLTSFKPPGGKRARTSARRAWRGSPRAWNERPKC